MAFSVEEMNTIRHLKRKVGVALGSTIHDNFTLKKLRSRNIPFVIAGGYFASSFRGEVYNDIDVFLLDRTEIFDSFFFPPDLKSTRKVGGSMSGSMGSHPAIIESVKFGNDPHRVNIISTKFMSLKEVLDSFDYWHCCVSYDFYDDALHVSPKAYHCIMNRQLMRTKSPYAPSQIRVEKLIKAGYTYATTENSQTKSFQPQVSAWHAIARYRADMDELVYGGNKK